MKILFITDGIYPFAIGGMQKHSAYALKQFAGTEHRIHVITAADKHANQEDYAAKIFGNTHTQNITFEFLEFPSFPRFPGHYVLASWIFSKRVTNALNSHPDSYDIIYAKGFTSWNLGKHKNEIQTPVAAQLHGLEMFQKPHGLKDFLVKYLLKFPAKAVVKNADYLLSYGGKIKNLILALGKNESCIFEQYGAVDEFWLSPPPPVRSYSKPLRLLFVARYEFRKGHHILNAAMDMLNNQGIPFHLKIVGEVPQDVQMKMSTVEYCGNCTAEEIKELCDLSDILVLPSLAEGFPTILVEAMSRGLIPIATDVGAVSAVVNEQNGWLIPAGEPASLFAAINDACHSTPEHLAQKSNHAVTLVASAFNWKSMHKTLVSHLQSMIHDYRKRTDS